jgi:hypothetical protein
MEAFRSVLWVAGSLVSSNRFVDYNFLVYSIDVAAQSKGGRREKIIERVKVFC